MQCTNIEVHRAAGVITAHDFKTDYANCEEQDAKSLVCKTRASTPLYATRDQPITDDVAAYN